MKDARTMRVGVASYREGAFACREDDVAVEEPLEIRVAGEALAITMRTPGDDRALALGFLLAEGVIHSASDVGSVFHCGRPGTLAYGNAIEVTPGPGVSLDVDRLARTHRTKITTSACGVCGREAIEDLLDRLKPNENRAAIETRLIAQLPSLLAQVQPVFAKTGGLHAACGLTRDGEMLAAAEDVGRHNAVDKVAGNLLLAGKLPRDLETGRACVLAVSGRASFEIVQKAAVSGFSCVASVSAPSSLAIETAEALGITLIAFARGASFSVYAHPDRVAT